MFAVKISNLTLRHNNKKIFSSLSLTIDKGIITTIIGPSGCGKTSLAKLIINKHKKIEVDGNCECIYTNPNRQIIGKTVLEQLEFHLKNQNYSERKINARIKKIIKDFSLESILDKDPFCLSYGKKQLVVLLSYLVLDLDILIMDNCLSMLDKNCKDLIFKLLKKRKVTVIHLTNNSEDILYGKKIVILNKKVIEQGTIKTLLSNEKAFINNHQSLPFLADLSLKLQYYDIVDEIILDMDKMVNKIWK